MSKNYEPGNSNFECNQSTRALRPNNSLTFYVIITKYGATEKVTSLRYKNFSSHLMKVLDDLDYEKFKIQDFDSGSKVSSYYNGNV